MQRNHSDVREPQGGDTLCRNLAFVATLFVVAYLLLQIAAAVEGGGL